MVIGVLNEETEKASSCLRLWGGEGGEVVEGSQ